MSILLNPYVVLGILRLTKEDVAWLQDEAEHGRGWHLVLNNPEAVRLLGPVWLRGQDLWRESSPELRAEHLHPAVPFWDALLLGWAQVRLNYLNDLSRRTIGWSTLTKSFIVGPLPSYPGMADTYFKVMRERILMVAELMGVQTISLGTDDLTQNENFTHLAFGLLSELLLDPDRDMVTAKIRRSIGFLDQARSSIKSEDLNQARKILLELIDNRETIPGSLPKLGSATIDWRGIRNKFHEAFDEMKNRGEKMNPGILAAKAGFEERYSRDLVDGLLDDVLPEDVRRCDAYMLGLALGVPVSAYFH